MATVTTIKIFQVIAHQGGWDEFLLVAGPLGIIGLLLWMANKRVSAQLEETKTPERD